jgi:Tfp pilus assembly protein PilX
MRKRLTSIFRRRLSEERGIALILTLAIIALVTLLLIAFVTSMRVENGASKSFNDLVKTRELALGAIDQAVATIRQATPERTDASAGNFSTYVTFPGVIWTNNNGAYGPVYLYSAPTSTDTTNLNAGFWITGQNPVEFPNEANSAINVGWLYVAQDPTTAPGPANPIIGRYVFWTDDEASKINLNTAGQPPLPPVPDYGTSTSTDVDLSVLLPGLSAAAITARQAVPAFTPATPGYNTIEEVKLADSPANADSDFNTNRFYLTTYSNDANYPSYQDDLDAFGRLRRPLFFPVAAAVSQLDLLPTTVGGAYQRMIDPTLTAIYGGTFGGIGGKYPPVAGGADGVQQIIANIIAYQHDPQSGLVADFPPDGFGNPPPYLGLARVPYINEVQVKYTDNGNGTVSRTVSVELYYPYSADAPYTSGVVGTEDTITLLGLPVGVPATFPGGPVTITVPGSTVFNNGTPQVFTSVSAPATVAAPPTTVTFLPASIFVNYAPSRPSCGLRAINSWCEPEWCYAQHSGAPPCRDSGLPGCGSKRPMGERTRQPMGWI